MATEATLPAFDTTDYLAGDQYFRPNAHRRIGDMTSEHDHRFPHAVIAVAGWYLLQLHAEDGTVEKEIQIAAPEHAKLRALRRIKGPSFVGGRAIHFAPQGHYAEILADRRHSMIALAEDSAFCCTYSYRDPATGGKVIEWNGWMGAVE